MVYPVFPKIFKLSVVLAYQVINTTSFLQVQIDVYRRPPLLIYTPFSLTLLLLLSYPMHWPYLLLPGLSQISRVSVGRCAPLDQKKTPLSGTRNRKKSGLMSLLRHFLRNLFLRKLRLMKISVAGHQVIRNLSEPSEFTLMHLDTYADYLRHVEPRTEF